MKKKAIAILLLLCCLFSIVCATDTGSDITMTARLTQRENGSSIDRVLLVTGQAGDAFANSRVTVSVLRAGMELDTEITPGMSWLDKYATVRQGYADKQGDFRFEFLFNEAEGDYTVYARIGDKLLPPQSIHCYPTDVLVGLLSALNAGTVTVDELYTTIWNDSEKIGLDASIFKELKEATGKSICSAIVNKGGSYTLADLHLLYEENLILKGMTSGDLFDCKTAIINTYESTKLHLKELPVWSLYNDMEKEQQKQVMISLDDKAPTTIEKLREEFTDCVAMVAFSDLDNYSEVATFVDQYAVILGDSAEAFEDLSKREQKVLSTYVMKNRKKAGDIQEIIELFQDGLDNLEELLEENEKSSTGGFSGVGNVTVGNSVVASTPAPTLAPAQKTNLMDLEEAAWAQKSILQLCEKGIVAGKDNTHFAPNDAVTRAEFVKMLTLAFGYTAYQKPHTFTDVDSSHWADPYISGIANVGLILGDAQGCFHPDANITREDIATILYRLLNYENYQFNISSFKLTYTDVDQISDYAINGVGMLSEIKLLNGFEDHSFRPGQLATRAEAAYIIANIMELF